MHTLERMAEAVASAYCNFPKSNSELHAYPGYRVHSVLVRVTVLPRVIASEPAFDHREGFQELMLKKRSNFL